MEKCGSLRLDKIPLMFFIGWIHYLWMRKIDELLMCLAKICAHQDCSWWINFQDWGAIVWSSMWHIFVVLSNYWNHCLRKQKKTQRISSEYKCTTCSFYFQELTFAFHYRSFLCVCWTESHVTWQSHFLYMWQNQTILKIELFCFFWRHDLSISKYNIHIFQTCNYIIV